MILLSITAAAKALKLSRSRLYQLITNDRIKVKRIGGHPFIAQADITSFKSRPGGWHGQRRNIKNA